MYAVIKTGGKQYRVQEGDKLKVEKLDTAVGKKHIFNEVIMLGEGDKVTIGTPLIEKASVEAKIVAQGKGKKVNIIKFRRRKHHLKRQGHRQLFTEIEIGKIKA